MKNCRDDQPPPLWSRNNRQGEEYGSDVLMPVRNPSKELSLFDLHKHWVAAGPPGTLEMCSFLTKKFLLHSVMEFPLNFPLSVRCIKLRDIVKGEVGYDYRSCAGIDNPG